MALATPRVAALNDELMAEFTEAEVEVIVRFLNRCIPPRDERGPHVH